MSAPTILSSWRSVVLGLFPWLQGFGLSSSGALAIGGAAGRTELEGGGAAVGRVGDLVVRLCVGSGGTLYVSTGLDGATSYTWTPVATALTPAPLPTNAGTRVGITAGSKKVSCG